MKAVKGAIVLATILATVAVAACRREEHYEFDEAWWQCSRR